MAYKKLQNDALAIINDTCSDFLFDSNIYVYSERGEIRPDLT